MGSQRTTDPLDRLVVGSRNQGKIAEIAELLAGTGIALLSLADFPDAPDPEEDSATYAGNARKKALALAAHTGLPTLSDDSGLEVDALDGEPGVRSARYAGEGASDAERIEKVLNRLADRGVQDSAARFRCALCLAAPGRVLLEVEAECPGRVAGPPRGSRGFGYDPVFTPHGEERTFGELPAEVKNRISHRGRALRRFQEALGRLREKRDAP